MEKLIGNEIRRFVAEDAGNSHPERGEPYYDEPLVGFASGGDPLFHHYKKVIGEFHQTPAEVMTSAFGNESDAATVISWVLPVARQARVTNGAERQWPSREWAEQRSYGEAFNNTLRRHMVQWLASRGHHAVAPVLATEWRQVTDPRVGLASTWSERHAAFAAGLGTFSINDALITLRGIAHRLGSVVTDLALTPTPRPYDHVKEYCLLSRWGSCGACISRCPTGAISVFGHDKKKCSEYVYGSAQKAVGELYGVPATGCGLCQTRVPCEAGIPQPPKKKDEE